MGDLANLLIGIGTMLTGIAAVGALFVVPRRSDRESRKAASIAVDATQQEPPDNVTPIEPKPKAKP